MDIVKRNLLLTALWGDEPALVLVAQPRITTNPASSCFIFYIPEEFVSKFVSFSVFSRRFLPAFINMIYAPQILLYNMKWLYLPDP